MTQYLALLRGINVGTKNRIKMDALRQMLEGIGLEDVQTYLQSGNVIFSSDGEEQILRRQIEDGIFQTFGITAPAIIRTKEELRGVIDGLPFTVREIAQAQTANTDGESLYVYFLDMPPDAAAIGALERFADGDRFFVGECGVYLLVTQSIRHSKLAARIQTLGAAVTARNWNTVLKLYQLMADTS